MNQDDIEFERLYGPWDALNPGEVADVMGGYGGEWWIAGGWAIDAFTRRSRPHHDIDVAVWRDDLDMLRRHLGSRYHLWSVGSGMQRPLNDDFPELHERSDQVWVRTDASSPWLMDFLMTDRRDGDWVFKRDPARVFPLETATWTSDDGLRYLRPEFVLAMKAALARPQDESDLLASLPRMSDEARSWLRLVIEDLYPGHEWLAKIDPSDLSI